MTDLSKYTISQGQLETLASNADKHRDARLIETLYWLASRVTETVELTKSQLQRSQAGRIVVFTDRKNQHQSKVPMENKRLYKDLERLGDQGNTAYLFESERGGHISRQHAHRIIKRLSRDCNIAPIPNKDHITPHTLRHSRARHLKDQGVDMEIVQQILGHSSMRTTSDQYGTPSSDDVARAILE